MQQVLLCPEEGCGHAEDNDDDGSEGGADTSRSCFSLCTGGATPGTTAVQMPATIKLPTP